MTRGVVALALLIACACRAPAGPSVDRPPTGPDVRKADEVAPLPPGSRLPDAIAPIAYDLALQVDPDVEGFHGHVEIRVRATAATDVVWLHAVDLAITAAAARDGDAGAALQPLAPLGDGEQMRGYRLPHALAAGAETTLVFDYTGSTAGDQEGLFRQQVRGRWYVFAQSESVFARRITPCFDEPRWKPTWRVRLAVPHGASGLSNAPEVARRVRADGAIELDFAPTPAMPSYLLSIAVGPFDIVPAGAMGRAHVPVRVAVPAGDGARAAVVAKRLPAIVDALEAYFDQPLPIAKLDLVGVPRFFGGMENPGLITFVERVLVGDPDDVSDRRTFERFAAHELAHLWLGDLVTPAWWDDLWLAEAFASWLGDKVIAADGFDDAALRIAQQRELALDADALPDARPLRRAVVHADDAEAAFDAIAYDKGEAVLAMIERWIGSDAMRDVLRGYVRAHANGDATSADFIAAFAAIAAARPAIGDILGSYIDHAGTPVVELELRCDAHAAHLVAQLRAPAIAVPLCVRYAAGATCGVVAAARSELALPGATACPAWVIANAGGAGYYATRWMPNGVGPRAPIAIETPAERLADGDDLAGAVARGDLAPTAALAEISRLAASGDPYAALAALAIARAVAPLVDDATAPRWASYLAARYADRLAPDAMLAPPTPVTRAIRDRLLELVPADHLPPATVRRARADLDRALAAGIGGAQLAPLEVLAAIAGGGADRFARLLALAARTPADDADLRDELYEVAGELGVENVGAAIDAVAAPDGDAAWPALRGYLERPATAAAAWTALHDRVDAVLAHLTPDHAHELVATTAHLCDPSSVAAVTAALAASPALDSALAVANRCIARRARAKLTL